MWFELKGDKRLDRCTSESCGGQPTWRLEAGGVASDYCSGCKEKIERINRNEREMAEGTRCDGSCSDGLPCHC